MAHNYDNPQLESLIAEAHELYRKLAEKLYSIQEITGIPGLHTNINSDDDTAGVLERIQYIHDDGLDVTLETFKEFDNEL